MSCCLPVVLVTTYCRPIVPPAPPTLSAASLFPFCVADTFSVIGNALEAGLAAPPSAITDVTPPSAPSWATTVWPVSSEARAGTATTTRAAVSPTAPKMATRLRSLVDKDTGTPEGTMWTNVTQVQLGNVDALSGRRAGVAAPVGGACVARVFAMSVNGRWPIPGTD